MLTLSFQENDTETAHLHLNSRYIQRLSKLSPSVIDITSRLAPERAKVEAFIRGIYKDSYCAEIEVTYPMLMSIRDEEGKILAAVGFRLAEKEPLFLEHYTQRPIEEALTDCYRASVPRNKIVEIGNLASAGQGASIFLFTALSSYLDSLNISHAVITGTDFLRERLYKLGLAPHILCDADPALLPSNKKDHWGTYYETQPSVLAGSISESVLHLQKALGVVFEDRRPPLVSRLHPRITI